MNLVDCLLEDHRRLRYSLNSIHDFLANAEVKGDDWWKYSQIDFKNKLRDFISEMTAHESMENQLLFEAIGELGEDSVRTKKALAGDHKSIHAILGILSSLSFLSGEVSRGAVSFAVSQARLEIERHLEREEIEIFPKLRQGLLPDDLRRLGERASELLHHVK